MTHKSPMPFSLLRRAMRGLLALLLSSLWLPLAVAREGTHACDNTAVPASAATAPQESRDRGFLWRVSKEGHSSYLYGTLHVGRPEWASPGRSVAAALRDTDMLAMELDLTDTRTTAQVADSMRHGNPALTPSLRARLQRQFAAACMQPGPMARLHPLMQALTLTLLAGRQEGLDPAYAQELMLASHARTSRRPVVGLESVQRQMQALMPRGDGAGQAMIEQLLQQLEDGTLRPVLRRVAKVWEQGDFEQLERYAEWCDCARTPAERALLARLTDERNPGMAERIDALHREGHRVFAAVGALHMAGHQGLPRLLARRGYTVERVLFEQ
ncbi:MAG TPA: TraB/GumN family protein [Burkholderiaceae bacterium]|nr:TraB/GumN family protein [Burkholderiaceae bacterium]